MLKIIPYKKGILYPDKSYRGDAGFNLYAPEDITIYLNKVAIIPLGFGIQGDRDRMYFTQERSSHAMKYGITSIGNVIDSGYTGEISIILKNGNIDDFHVKKGEKIGQLVVVKVEEDHEVMIVASPNNMIPIRGRKGTGSSGK